MHHTNRIALLTVTVILLTSLFMVEAASAVEWNLFPPEFTLTVEDGTLCLTINNKGTDPSVGYNVRIKHSAESNWTELFSGNEILSQNYDSEYTVYAFPDVDQKGGSFGRGYMQFSFSGSVDFQVERKRSEPVGRQADAFGTWIYDIKESAWSNTQTYTFSQALPNTPTPTPRHETLAPTVTASPSQTGTPSNIDPVTTEGIDWMQTATLTLLIVIVALLVIDIFYVRRRSRR